MREIKFRTWYEKDKLMSVNPAQNMFSKSEPVMLNRLVKEFDILMQFTGLLDKNGKEIYKGDIVKWSVNDNDLGQVVFDTKVIVEYRKEVYETVNEISGWYVREGKTQMFGLAGAVQDKIIEIIGNIYENPELLK